jgi:ubiquinone/menaquinone biosynthesis C-methylase UbiE
MESYICFIDAGSCEIEKVRAKSDLFLNENLGERIREANVEVHRFEARYYELLHPEVYNKQEQKRIDSTLKVIDKLVADNQRKALDFGAGTGNLTGKLLRMGYHLTAIDISAEMCTILRKKYKTYLEAEKLTIINSPIENVSFDKGEFDLVTCYSVLHHLPDYVDAVRRLCVFLKKGGVMYLDHEASPFYWRDEPDIIANLVKHVYFHSNPLLNAFYFEVIGMNVPSLDYTLSDYWHKKEHALDHEKIKCVFEGESFNFFARADYHLKGSWILNPIFYAYKHVCKPEMSFWVAKK